MIHAVAATEAVDLDQSHIPNWLLPRATLLTV